MKYTTLTLVALALMSCTSFTRVASSLTVSFNDGPDTPLTLPSTHFVGDGTQIDFSEGTKPDGLPETIPSNGWVSITGCGQEEMKVLVPTNSQANLVCSNGTRVKINNR